MHRPRLDLYGRRTETVPRIRRNRTVRSSDRPARASPSCASDGGDAASKLARSNRRPNRIRPQPGRTRGRPLARLRGVAHVGGARLELGPVFEANWSVEGNARYSWTGSSLKRRTKDFLPVLEKTSFISRETAALVASKSAVVMCPDIFLDQWNAQVGKLAPAIVADPKFARRQAGGRMGRNHPKNAKESAIDRGPHRCSHGKTPIAKCFAFDSSAARRMAN